MNNTETPKLQAPGQFAEAHGSAALLEVGVCHWCQPKLNWPREAEHLAWTSTLLCAVCREHHAGSYWLVAPPGAVLCPAAAKRVKLPNISSAK